jgi:hypothetical protein
MATIRRGTTATGRLIWTAPQPLKLTSFTPTPPEPPVPTLSAKATIASYETPIRVDGTSAAVAKVTQGTPQQFRWQFQDQTAWVTQATNAASDLDHHYKFPHAGSFPIRLQTLVNGVVVDQSSSTSRVVVVEPLVTPPEPEPPDPGPGPPQPGEGEVLLHLTDMRNEAPIPGADAWWQLTPEVVKQTDASGHVILTATSQSGVCVKKAGYHSPGLPEQDHTCVTILPPRVPIELTLERVPPPPPPVPDIHAGGKIFYDDANRPWRYKGVSAFKLGYLYETGQDIRPFLEAYRGFNVLRVWAYTDWANGWPRPSSAAIVREFLAQVGSFGFLVEYTFLTNDSLAMSDWARDFVAQLCEPTRPRMFAEIRNEPQTHSQTVSTQRLKPAFDASRLVYSSGNYEQSANAFGPYLVYHSQRDKEWCRRAHDAMEYYNGGGPHKPTDPAHKVPCIGDEPPKPSDVAAPTPGPLHLTKADDYRAYFGTCAILGGGATFHCATAMQGLLPTEEEKALAAAALEGLDAFPADAPLGQYTRPNDSSLRTYVVGNYSVRIRPTTPNHPGGSAWKRVGASPILWRR